MFGPSRRVARRTARRTSRRVNRRQNAMYDDQGYDEGYDEPQQAPPPQAAPAQPDMTDQLQDLAKLHEQGILTDEEFAAKKKEILGI
jgi:putative oligomerization/nucleic acid binding protein